MHERAEIDLRGLLIGCGIIAAGIVASLAAAWMMIAVLDAGPSGPNGVAAPPIASLQPTAPQAQREAYQREKNALLHGQDGKEGRTARIPIEEAMRMLAGSDKR